MNNSLRPSRRSGIEPFIVMDVLKAANDRQAIKGDVLHLELGEPGFGAPDLVIEAATDALRSQPLRYTEAFGFPALRDRIAAHYQETYGVSLSPGRIVVTQGSSAAFILAFLVSFDHGARIAIAEPGYPAYRNTAQALDLTPVPINAGAAEGFIFTASAIEKTPDLDGVLIASPANPTGTMIPVAELGRIADCCASRGIRLISDEIYHGITYNQPGETVLSLNADAIVINSFSKYFCMTGWRLGWMVLPENLLRPVERLAQNLFISPSALSQIAAIKAFDCKEELDSRVKMYNRNRLLIVDTLADMGVTALAPPDGAFYVYADVSGLSSDSAAFCKLLLDETGLALTPGTDFDHTNGRRYVRICYAESEENVAEAARRMAAWQS